MTSSRGFSLTEILVSMLLIATGLMAIGHTMVKGMEANYWAKRESEAISYAQQKIEHLRSLPLTHADLTVGTHSDTPAPRFIRSWTVTQSGNERTILLTLTHAIPGQTAPVRVILNLVRVQ